MSVQELRYNIQLLSVIEDVCCNSCKKILKTINMCIKCHDVYYCCKECQIKDWPEHSKTCNSGEPIIDKINRIRKKIDCKNYCNNCCEDSENLLLCGKCKKTKYCSIACQKEDWSIHKKICK